MQGVVAKWDAGLAYQQQDSPQTLAQGLEEYYAANQGRVTRPQDLPPGSAELFASHDICHVIFGLSTSPSDEVLADLRTMMSCDVGLRRYAAYLARDAQAQAIFKDFGYLRALRETLAAAPRIARGIAASWRMTRRWPWTPPLAYSARRLADLRREFGIRVV